VDPFVVSINRRAQAEYRSFWAGPVGTALLVVPGLVVAVAGFALGLVAEGSGRGTTVFFALVIVFSGLYASYAGWDHRRKALSPPEVAPLAFAIEADGVVFPRGKHVPWREVRLVLTDEEQPRILCSPVGLAYPVDRLDRAPGEINAAMTELSAGRARLEGV
jgi:hypothetical protein